MCISFRPENTESGKADEADNKLDSKSSKETGKSKGKESKG